MTTSATRPSDEKRKAPDSILSDQEIREPPSPEDDPNHGHNFLVSIYYQICLRVGWIFKTESVIMPAVLDVIGGSAWLRGFLPVLNRLGQSIPPLLASDRIRNAPQKRRALFWSTATMGSCFLFLSLVFSQTTQTENTGWLPICFLIAYGIFFTATGMNQLVLNTLTGKLIRTTKRGALSLYATAAGAGLGAICAYFLLHLWLSSDRATAASSRFELVFGFTGVAFMLGALATFGFKEMPDPVKRQRRSGRQLIAASMHSLKTNRNFLLLAIAASLFGMCFTLFPHYQRFARDRFELSMTALIPWVIAQNLGAAAFSIPAGWFADRFGTRVVLRTLTLVTCIAPCFALVLANNPELGWGWFTGVFCLLGLTPVTMRFFNYYTLEIASREDHPRFLSTMSIAMALPPVLLSIPLGALMEQVGFEVVFVGVTLCMFAGWVLTFFLEEPRHSNESSHTN